MGLFVSGKVGPVGYSWHPPRGGSSSPPSGPTQAERDAADAQLRDDWLDAMQPRTVLGHPEVWRTVDQEQWRSLVWQARLIVGSLLLSIAVVAGVCFALSWASPLTDDELMDVVFFAMFGGPTMWWLFYLLFRHGYFRWVNRQFAASGWDVETLMAEIKAERKASERAATEAWEAECKARRDRKNSRYPTPPS